MTFLKSDTKKGQSFLEYFVVTTVVVTILLVFSNNEAFKGIVKGVNDTFNTAGESMTTAESGAPSFAGLTPTENGYWVPYTGEDGQDYKFWQPSDPPLSGPPPQPGWIQSSFVGDDGIVHYFWMDPNAVVAF